MKDRSQRFSERYGYERTEPPREIAIREEAPRELRSAVVELARKAGLSSTELIALAVRFVDSKKKPWDPPVRHVGMPTEADAVMILERWDWSWVYDFIEMVYAAVAERTKGERLYRGPKRVRTSQYFRRLAAYEADQQRPEHIFEEGINTYFEHVGIGWQLVKGQIETRGQESFEAAVHKAATEFEEAGRSSARREIREALYDLSRRPEPDLTGAIHHSMAALECVARDVTGDSKATLGEILKKHADVLLPKPLDKALAQVWGYASEKARHLREGNEPGREEAELVVSLASSTAAYLSQKFR